MDKHTDLISRLQDEADLCRNDGAGDIAALLDEAATALEAEKRKSDANGWRQKAAAWLRSKADAQEKVNREYPRHASAYPSWEKRVRDLRWDADELEGKFGAYGAPGPKA